MRKPLFLCFVLLFCASGCLRADRRNSNCQWPAESPRQLDLSKAEARRQLSSDSQLAEDLAIRYVDAHNGPHSGHFESWAAYNTARDHCQDSLFAKVAGTDGVTGDQVRDALTQRPTAFDLSVGLSFAIIYFLLANAMARRFWRHFAAQDGLIAGFAASGVVSAMFSAAGVLVGEIWSGLAENIRVGNGHLSYRSDRIPWHHHHISFFLIGLALFWIAGALQAGRRRADPSLSLLIPDPLGK